MDGSFLGYWVTFFSWTKYMSHLFQERQVAAKMWRFWFENIKYCQDKMFGTKWIPYTCGAKKYAKGRAAFHTTVIWNDILVSNSSSVCICWQRVLHGLSWFVIWNVIQYWVRENTLRQGVNLRWIERGFDVGEVASVQPASHNLSLRTCDAWRPNWIFEAEEANIRFQEAILRSPDAGQPQKVRSWPQ